MRQVAVCLLLLITSAPAVHDQASPASHARAIETALDRGIMDWMGHACPCPARHAAVPGAVSKRHVPVTAPQP